MIGESITEILMDIMLGKRIIPDMMIKRRYGDARMVRRQGRQYSKIDKRGTS
jgi:hypothetical protein